MKKKTSRLAWGLAAVLAALVPIEIGILFLRPFWLAKYWGERAELAGAILLRAPLREARLGGANLKGSHEAWLSGATDCCLRT